MTTKQVVLEVLSQLPEDFSWEDFEYQLYVRRSIQEGLESEQRGELLTLDEVRERLAL